MGRLLLHNIPQKIHQDIDNLLLNKYLHFGNEQPGTAYLSVVGPPHYTSPKLSFHRQMRHILYNQLPLLHMVCPHTHAQIFLLYGSYFEYHIDVDTQTNLTTPPRYSQQL